MKKVAYFTNQYPKVSHSFIRREILALERIGYQVSRFALRGWDENLVDPEDLNEQKKTRYVLKAGLPALFVQGLHVLMMAPGGFFRALLSSVTLGYRSDRPLPVHLIYFLEACLLYKWVMHDEIEHIHGHFGTNPAEVIMLVKMIGGPEYSFTVHGPEEFDRPRFLKLEEKIKTSKFVVAISSFGRSQLFRTLGYEDWHKVKEVHCGLDAEFYNKNKSAVPDNNRLVCVGRLCEQKGQLLLIDAIHRLKNKGVEIQLVLAGDGELRGEVEHLIRKYELSGNVVITGWISSDQVRDELLNSRALVLPSFAEGLPVVIMEAMSLRRPVLSTHIAGIPELVQSGTNGWLFPAGSVDSLVEAIENCLNTPIEKLEGMSESGFERVVARHNVDVEAAKLGDYILGAVRDEKK